MADIKKIRLLPITLLMRAQYIHLTDIGIVDRQRMLSQQLLLHWLNQLQSKDTRQVVMFREQLAEN